MIAKRGQINQGRLSLATLRELIGPDSDRLSDEQLTDLRERLYTIGQILVRDVAMHPNPTGAKTR